MVQDHKNNPCFLLIIVLIYLIFFNLCKWDYMPAKNFMAKEWDRSLGCTRCFRRRYRYYQSTSGTVVRSKLKNFILQQMDYSHSKHLKAEELYVQQKKIN
jgi:hypothetical protein